MGMFTIKIDAKNAIRGIKALGKDLQNLSNPLKLGTNILVNHALAKKPWQDRTYNLREQHNVAKVSDLEYKLEIDTTIGAPKKEEYGQVLESQRKWRWIAPAVAEMQDVITDLVRAEVNEKVRKF